MKALSLKQPWAGLIAVGLKTIETRTWQTNYRGDVLILASQTVDKEASRHFEKEYSKEENWGHLAEYFKPGLAVCITEIYDCRPMTELDEEEACCSKYPGAWSFLLRNTRLIKPFPAKGALNIFETTITKEQLHIINK